VSEEQPVDPDGNVDADANQPARPLLRVVRGDPSPEEIAALVAVLAARSGGGAGEQPAQPSAWSRPSFAHSRPLSVGPGAWRLSATDAGARTRADW
jgi:hypothetical protein